MLISTALVTHLEDVMLADKNIVVIKIPDDSRPMRYCVDITDCQVCEGEKTLLMENISCIRKLKPNFP